MVVGLTVGDSGGRQWRPPVVVVSAVADGGVRGGGRWWPPVVLSGGGGGGKLNAEIKVKSDADKFWKAIMDSTTILPKASYDTFKAIEVVEGDGWSVGSVHVVHFAEGSLSMKPLKEKVEDLDEAKKKVTYSVIDGDLMQYYKSFKTSIEVIPEGEGSLVKWFCEFEKVSEEVSDPEMIRDASVKSLKQVDDFLLKA
ncbi:hypothetical protein R6Q57_024835 [Mikania cordata]